MHKIQESTSINNQISTNLPHITHSSDNLIENDDEEDNYFQNDEHAPKEQQLVHFGESHCDVDSENENDIGDDEDLILPEVTEKLIKSPHDLIFIIAMGTMYLFYYCGFALMAPFFAKEAAKKGVGSTAVGWIFAVYPLVCFVLSPLAGKWIPVIGPKFALFAGSFIQGGSQVLFGFVSDMPSKHLFIIFCFLIRTVAAIGSAFTETAVLSLISMRFEKNTTNVFSILEIFSGLGLAIGPVLGGFLYKIGGFNLPFFVTGGVNLIVIFVMFIVLHKTPGRKASDSSQEQDETGSILAVLKVPAISVLCIVSTTSGATIACFDPTLAPFLEKITNNGLTTEKIGLVFLIPAFCYMVFAPIAGWLVGIKVSARWCIIGGLFLNIIGFLFVGPAPFIPIKPTLWLVCVSFCVLGPAAAFFVVPILGDMQTAAKKNGLSNNLATMSIVSGLFTGFSSIGFVLGPVVAGFSTDHTSFEWTMTYLMAFLILEFIGLVCFTLWEKKKERNGSN